MTGHRTCLQLFLSSFLCWPVLLVCWRTGEIPVRVTCHGRSLQLFLPPLLCWLVLLVYWHTGEVAYLGGTELVYSFFSHPSYVGQFYWSFGTQVRYLSQGDLSWKVSAPFLCPASYVGWFFWSVCTQVTYLSRGDLLWKVSAAFPATPLMWAGSAGQLTHT